MTTKCITCTPNATLSQRQIFRALKEKDYIIYRITLSGAWQFTKTQYFSEIQKANKGIYIDWFHSSEFNGDMSE